MCMSCLRPPKCQLVRVRGSRILKRQRPDSMCASGVTSQPRLANTLQTSLNSVSVSYIFAFYCYLVTCEKGEVTEDHVDYMAHGFAPVGVYGC